MLRTGRPLAAALPDLPRLLEDPEGYLAEAPLEIGPPPLGWIALLLAVPGVMLPYNAIGLERIDYRTLSLGLAAAAAALFFAVWWLLARGHRLVLRPGGAEVIHHGSTVWVPWAVFRSQRLVVREEWPGRWGLVVPVDAASVGLIELRHRGRAVARGEEARGPQWELAGPGEALLPGRYEIAPADIAELLLLLGNRLGGDAPLGPVPTPPPGAWNVVPLALLRLPDCCSKCGGTPEASVPSGPLEVQLCGRCRDRLGRGAALGGVLGLLTGGGLGALLGCILSPWWGMAGLLLGMVLGTPVGLRRGGSLPVRVRHHSPWRGVAAVRFENPAVEEAALGPLRRPENS